MSRYKIWFVVLLAALVAGETFRPALAGRIGGGGGGVRAQSRSSVNANMNRNTNINRNVNVNRDVNVNVHNSYGGGYYGGGCCYHPVATAVAATAAVAVTAAVVGSIVNSVPPSCTSVIVNGLAYQQCGNTWYQPQMSGSATTYIVVNPPR